MLTKKIQINVESAWHPIEEYVPELVDLIQEVQSRSYSFEEDLFWIQSLTFSITEHPEESVAEFNELYARVQSFHSRVTSILISILQEKAIWQRLYQRAKRLYRKARGGLLHSRKDIKELRNKELQEAAVHEEIRELVDVQEAIGFVLEDLDLLVEIVELKKEELDKANTNLSRQQKAVETLVGVGYPVQGARS